MHDMSKCQTDYIKLFDSEFKELTNIGNNFRIRHHETNAIDITDIFFTNTVLSTPNRRAVDVEYSADLKHCKTCHKNGKRFVFNGG